MGSGIFLNQFGFQLQGTSSGTKAFLGIKFPSSVCDQMNLLGHIDIGLNLISWGYRRDSLFHNGIRREIINPDDFCNCNVFCSQFQSLAFKVRLSGNLSENHNLSTVLKSMCTAKVDADVWFFDADHKTTQ